MATVSTSFAVLVLYFLSLYTEVHGSGSGAGGSGTRGIFTSSKGTCSQDTIEKIPRMTSPNETCTLAEELLECELKERPNFRPSESEIRRWEEWFQNNFTEEMQCQVDVRKVLERLQHGNYGVSLFSATWSLRGMIVSLLSVFVIFGLM